MSVTSKIGPILAAAPPKKQVSCAAFHTNGGDVQCRVQALPGPSMFRLRRPLPFQPLDSGAALIGFGFAGLFDGILLQQVLQWHHLLSGLSNAPFGELSVQVLADGLFQGVMLLLLFAGLVRLVQCRHQLARHGGDLRVLGHALLGFGAWPFIDSLLLNGLLGLHRVRTDVAVPLVWDAAWLLMFGVTFLFVGWRLGRR